MLIKGLIGSTFLVTATTIDDAIWLTRYCSPTLPVYTRIIHASIFIITLQILIGACVLFSYLVKEAVDYSEKEGEADGEDEKNLQKKESIIVEIVGALLCWSIAIFLYVKKVMKRRKRQAQRLLKQQQRDIGSGIEEGAELLPSSNNTDYGSNQHHDDEMSGVSYSSSSSSDDSLTDDILTTPSPWMVITLTTIGALDELIYFPSLILGKIFTPQELCIGTLFASILILVVILFFFAKCKKLVEFLDSIPLYGIVGVFAILLSISVVHDAIHDAITG